MSFEHTHLISSDCPAAPLCVPLECVRIIMGYFIDPLWEILFLPYIPKGGEGAGAAYNWWGWSV